MSVKCLYITFSHHNAHQLDYGHMAECLHTGPNKEIQRCNASLKEVHRKQPEFLNPAQREIFFYSVLHLVGEAVAPASEGVSTVYWNIHGATKKLKCKVDMG